MIEDALTQLKNLCEREETELELLLRQLLVYPSEKKRSAYARVVQRLGQTKVRLARWLDTNLGDMSLSGVAQANRTARQHIGFALSSIQVLALTLMHQTGTPDDLLAKHDTSIRMPVRVGQARRSKRLALSYYALMVGHSAVYKALFEGTLAELQANQQDLVRIKCSEDTCADCCSHADLIYSISGTSGPKLDRSLLPMHPWCTCTIEAHA